MTGLSKLARVVDEVALRPQVQERMTQTIADLVERELESRQIKFMMRVPGLVERYYALAARKRFENVWLGEIVEAFRARLKVLGSAPVGRS